MKRHARNPAAQAEASGAAAEADCTVPTTKTRRARRMARPVDPADTVNEMPAEKRDTARASTKIANVIALLERGEGATLAELVEATGWQPHTTRAALTGLKKKGHVVSKTKRDDVTCYQIEHQPDGGSAGRAAG